MIIKDHVKYWLESADHDLESAESLFASGKYDWCLFISHLILEKALKARYVLDNENKVPPKIHDLIRLSEMTTLKLNEEQRILLDEVNDFNLEARYPDFKLSFYKTCNKDFAEKYFLRIKEFYKWLKSLLK